MSGRVMSLPYPFQLQMASMRRPSLSSRRGGWGHPQRKVTCAPLRVLLYALSWGRLPGDPVHEMRSVRTQRRCNLVFGLLRQRAIFLFAVAKDRAVSGARHRSSLIGSRSRASAGYDPLGVLPTSRIAVLIPSFKRPPPLGSPPIERCVKGPTPRRLSKVCAKEHRELTGETATTARFLAFLAPRRAIFSPWRLRSESGPNGPRM